MTGDLCDKCDINHVYALCDNAKFCCYKKELDSNGICYKDNNILICHLCNSGYELQDNKCVKIERIS